jgi:hypothetical protein
MRSSRGASSFAPVVNSDHRPRPVGARRARSLLVACSLLVVACTAPPEAKQDAAGPPPECIAAAGAPVADAEGLAALRRAVETAPLYSSLAAKAAVASCRVSAASSKITIEYTFRDGGSLRATRDSSIEYSDQEARFASPPADDPVDVLTRVERAAFSADGCGIRWREPESQPAGDDSKSTETIYRGDVCNCQARVRTDAASRVVALTFRSAC